MDLVIAEHKKYIVHFIEQALAEDIGPGDLTCLSTVDSNSKSTAQLICKEDGVLAGIEIVQLLYALFDKELDMELFKTDGSKMKSGEIIYRVTGKTRSLLSTERLALNLVQKLSGVATKTNQLASLIADLPTKLLDTRKTTPGMRVLEKWAVKIGGGNNHRMGLYDMVMIKDNHIDQCGSITKAVNRASQYLTENGIKAKIEVETRSFAEIEEALSLQPVDWIMFDNFSVDQAFEAVKLVNKRKTTEISGGINENNLRAYALSGIDFISSGALTQKANALDLSLKIVKG